MKLISLFFTLLILVVPTLQAEDMLCKAVELDQPAIKQRAKVVQFPKDIEITLLGHVHGERANLKRFGNWVRNPDDELTNEEWTERVEDFIGSHQQTLEHVKQDLSFLRASLWQTPQPIFVALEAQDEDMAAHIEHAAQFRSALAQASGKREIDNLDMTRNAELITMGGPLYSYLYDSELRGKYELVGLESTVDGVVLQKEGKEKMRIAETRLASIKAKQGLDEDVVKKAMDTIVKSMNKSYDDIANIMGHDHTIIRDQLDSMYPYLDPQVKGAVLGYLFGYLDYLRGMKKRDIYFSRVLALQERSGVLLIGEQHLTSLANLLEAQCRHLRAGYPILLNVPEEPDVKEM